MVELTPGQIPPAAECIAVGEERYSELLRRAVLDPESLTPRDAARIEPRDWVLIDQALERVTKRAVFVHPRRQAELMRAARAGKLRMSSLPMDELVAIDATPGFAGALYDALADFDEGRVR